MALALRGGVCYTSRMKYGAYRRLILLATVSLLAAAHALAAYVGTNNTVIPALPPRIVSNGFVFIDNEYIDAPYCISNHILTIFINGRVAECIPDPGPPMIVSELPAVPPSITTTTSLNDTTFNSFCAAVQMYFAEHYAGDFVGPIAQFYAGLPNVSTVIVQDADIGLLQIESKSGERELYGVGTVILQDDIDVLKDLNRTMNFLASTIEKGGASFFETYPGGAALFSGFGPGVAERELPAILLLRDKKQEITDPEARIQVQLDRMKQAGGDFLISSDANLLTNLVASPQLEQRIQEMILRAQEPEPEE